MFVKLRRLVLRHETGEVQTEQIFAFMYKDSFLQRWHLRGIKYKNALIPLSPEVMENELLSVVSAWDGPIKTLTSSYIVTGLLFSFIGLSWSLFKIVAVFDDSGFLKNIAEIRPETFISALTSPLQGMAICFISSVTGLVLSLLSSNVLTFFDRNRMRVVDTIMQIVTTDIIPLYAPVSSQYTTEQFYRDTQAGMQKTFNAFFKEHSKIFYNSATFLKGVAENVQQGLGETNTMISTMVSSLAPLPDQLSESFRNNAENLKKITDDLKSFLEQNARDQQSGAKSILDASVVFQKHIANFTNLSEPLERVANQFSEFKEQVEGFFRTVRDIYDISPEQIQIFRNIQNELTVINDQVIRTRQSINDNNTAMNSIKEMAQNILAEFSTNMKENMQMSMKTLGGIQGRMTELVDRHVEGNTNAGDHSRISAEILNSIKEDIAQFARSVDEGMVRQIDYLKYNFSDLAQRMETAVSRLINLADESDADNSEDVRQRIRPQRRDFWSRIFGR